MPAAKSAVLTRIWRKNCPPLHLGLRASRSREEVFREFAERNNDPEIRKLANIFIDSDRFGSSLGPTLRTHARYLRIRRRQGAQEAARKITVKLSFLCSS